MKKQEKKKWNITIYIIIIVILLCILLFYVVKKDRKLSAPEQFLKDVVVNVQKAITYPFYQNRKKEMVDQTESNIIQKNVNETLIKEIQELKDALELNQTLTDYKIVNATTLSRSPNGWYQTITIDKGKKDGLKENMIVITKYGLIGKLGKLSNTTSEVKLITTSDRNYQISVEIVTENGNIPGILNGYDEKDHTVIINGISGVTDIKEGQDVITSGLGGVFPRGIYIGKIIKTENEKFDISKKIKVKLLQDFNEIHYVSVLARSVS